LGGSTTTCLSRELTSPTVIDAWSLCCLLPVWPLISTLVRRAARRGGVGRDGPLTMPGRGIVSGQEPGVALSWSADRRPAWGCPYHCLPCQRGPHEGKGRPDDPEGLPLPLMSLALPSVTHALPWPLKGKAGHPTKGHRFTTSHITPHHSRTTSIEPRTHS